MSTAAAALTDRAGRPPLLRLIRIEARKMVDTRAGFWLLVLTVLAAIGGMLGERLSFGDDVSFGRMYLTAAATSSILLPVVAVLLVTTEWSQRTGLITFTLVPVRGRIIAAKLIAALGLAAMGAIVCMLLAAIGAATASGPGLEAGEVGRGLLYLMIGTSVGVGLGLLLMNTPAAIVLLFVGPLLLTTVGAIGEGLNDVTRWLDQSVLQQLVEARRLESDAWEMIAVTVAFWVLLPLALGMLRLQRGDID